MSSTKRVLGVFYTCALIAALAGIIRPELALMQLLFGQHIPIMHRLAMVIILVVPGWYVWLTTKPEQSKQETTRASLQELTQE